MRSSPTLSPLGWTEFFSALPGLYHCNSLSGRLQLFPLLDGIRALLAAKPAAWRRSFWRATGRHVAGNIWQLFFWLDVRPSFISGSSPDDVPTHRLHWFQRHLERYTRGPLAETSYGSSGLDLVPCHAHQTAKVYKNQLNRFTIFSMTRRTIPRLSWLSSVTRRAASKSASSSLRIWAPKALLSMTQLISKLR